MTEVIGMGVIGMGVIEMEEIQIEGIETEGIEQEQLSKISEISILPEITYSIHSPRTSPKNLLELSYGLNHSAFNDNKSNDDSKENYNVGRGHG
jgi:hypothetical protein